jgi:hypothetical protein
MNMDDLNLGTIDGKKITPEMLEGLSARCEQDWKEDKATVSLTDYGKTLAALQALDMPVDEIEALERRAKHERKPFPLFIRSILRKHFFLGWKGQATERISDPFRLFQYTLHWRL